MIETGIASMSLDCWGDGLCDINTDRLYASGHLQHDCFVSIGSGVALWRLQQWSSRIVCDWLDDCGVRVCFRGFSLCLLLLQCAHALLHLRYKRFVKFYFFPLVGVQHSNGVESGWTVYVYIHLLNGCGDTSGGVFNCCLLISLYIREVFPDPSGPTNVDCACFRSISSFFSTAATIPVIPMEI